VLIHCGRVWESRSEKAFILGFRTAEVREVGRSNMPIIVKKQWRIFGNQNMAANRYTVARTGNRSCYSPAVHFEILNIKRRTLVRACVHDHQIGTCNVNCSSRLRLVSNVLSRSDKSKTRAERHLVRS